MPLKTLKYLGHHVPDGMIRRVMARSLSEGYIWISHVTHGWNAAGQDITICHVQPLPTEEHRIEMRDGMTFLREDAVEPGGPEGGLRLTPLPEESDG